MAYITTAELEAHTGLTIDASVNTYIATLISAVQDYIERYCGNESETGIKRREFAVSSGDTTRYYDAKNTTKVVIDDIQTITSLVINGTTLTENDDFYLYPLNETVKEWIELIQPETRLNVNSRLNQSSPYVADKGQRAIVVTGQFGYSTTTPPDAIKLVAMRLCASIIKETIGDTDVKEISQESLGEYSVSFASVKNMANRLEINEALDQFKRLPITPKFGVNKI